MYESPGATLRGGESCQSWKPVADLMPSKQLEGRCAGRTCGPGRAAGPVGPRAGGAAGRGERGRPGRDAPLPPAAAFRAFFRPVRSSLPKPGGGSDSGLQRAARFLLPAPLASSLLSLPLPTRAPGRKGDGGGRRAETSPRRPVRKAAQSCPAATGRAGPGEQRGALFSAVVSWPFDLSAAGETLPLTCG